jgi:hypothetical protein
MTPHLADTGATPARPFVRRDSGNTQRDSGNMRHDSRNTQRDSGNMRRDSRNTRHDSGNTRGDSGNSQLDSGNSRLDSGNTNPEAPLPERARTTPYVKVQTFAVREEASKSPLKRDPQSRPQTPRQRCAFVVG